MKYRITVDLTVKGKSPSFLEVKNFIGDGLAAQSEAEPINSPFTNISVVIGSIIAKANIPIPK